MLLLPGIESMASCGLSRKFPCDDHSKTQLIHEKERQILSRKDIVLNSIRIESARGHIQFQNALFVAHQELPVLSSDLPSSHPPSLPTPVKVKRLGFLLDRYNPSTVEFLSFGFTQGFPVHFQGERKSRTATNLMSALDNPEAVDAKLQKELEAHRLAGPFLPVPSSDCLLDSLSA